MNSPESTLERDLRAIDDAIRGAPRDPRPEVGELQDLALALSAETPRPDAEFSESLRERAKAGFPARDGSLRTWVRRLRAPRVQSLLPAAGFACLLLVALSVAVIALPNGDSGSGGGDDDSAGSVASGGGGGGSVESVAPAEPQSRALESSGDAAAKAAPDAASGALDSFRSAPVPPGGFAPGRAERKIERSVSLELATPADRMERLGEQVTAVTNRYGGFVLSSSLSTGGDGAGGEFDLRIPAVRLRAALRDLAGLATVRSQSQSGRDVTRQHVTAQDRLASARAERASLLRRLELADTDEAAEGLRRRLDLVAIEIRGLRSQLRSLRLSTNYATVTVSLVTGKGDSGSAGAFDDAVDDAGDLLVGTAGVLIRVLALALPLGLLALAAWLGTNAFRRRRRESALV
jgi:hypothetical protein